MSITDLSRNTRREKGACTSNPTSEEGAYHRVGLADNTNSKSTVTLIMLEVPTRSLKIVLWSSNQVVVMDFHDLCS